MVLLGNVPMFALGLRFWAVAACPAHRHCWRGVRAAHRCWCGCLLPGEGITDDILLNSHGAIVSGGLRLVHAAARRRLDIWRAS
jgi:hypothetical protein